MSKKRQISLQECYDLLQISKDATLEDVKKAYRKRAFELHPDLNPTVADAGHRFQRLNEAYVALSQILQTEESERKASAKKEEEKQKAESKQDSANKQDKAEDVKQEQAKQKAQDSRQRAASAAYAKEDVLRDLLHDPFARRVFEDIYSEVSKQAKPEPEKQETPPPPPPKPPKQPKQQSHTVQVDLGRNKERTIDKSKFSGKVMNWFRNQIDEEQSIKMPPSALFAGSKIRLQIRQGLAEDLSTIEIVLPKDFVAGKPIRLRGLGKKLGKWQGDLYLTIDSNKS